MAMVLLAITAFSAENTTDRPPDPTSCLQSLKEAESAQKAIEKSRDDFETKRKILVIATGTLTALAGVAVWLTEEKQKKLAAIVAAICGVLSSVSQFYEPSDTAKEKLTDAKKDVGDRRDSFKNGSFALIDVTDVTDSMRRVCLYRQAAKYFEVCVLGGEAGDVGTCPSSVPPASTSSTPTAAGSAPGSVGASSSHIAGAPIRPGAEHETSGERECSPSVHAVLASQTTLIAGRVNTALSPRFVTVTVHFGSNREVTTVDYRSGNTDARTVVDGAIRSKVLGDANCQTTVTYQW
jgi:hypothetical protein